MMRLSARIFVLPLFALLLMSADRSPSIREETESLLMPDMYMFGEDGNSPDLEAIRFKALQALRCTTHTSVSHTSTWEIASCPSSLRGDPVPVSNITLEVLRLNSTRDPTLAGFRCQQRDFRELEGNGIGYTQYCEAEGYRYEIQFSFYYGQEV